MKHWSLIVLGLVCLGLGWHGPAEAGSISGTALSELTFDSSNYVVRSGNTVQVSVFLSQLPTGGTDAAVSTVDPLYLAAFQISITNLTGVASVVSTSNITPNTAAFTSPPGTSSSVLPTLVSLSEGTFSGPGLGSLPGLLGTFTFTGIQSGTTQITVAPLAGEFATKNAETLSPSSATATISTIPEPSSILIVLSGGPLLLAGLVLRRSRRGATRESRQ